VRCATALDEALTTFLQHLGEADDEGALTEYQQQLHTRPFTVTTTGTGTTVKFKGTVPSLVGKLLARSCTVHSPRCGTARAER
jgi:hypothetical protein